MSAVLQPPGAITVRCDQCGARCGTLAACRSEARWLAARAGWAVAPTRRGAGPSNNTSALDRCPYCPPPPRGPRGGLTDAEFTAEALHLTQWDEYLDAWKLAPKLGYKYPCSVYRRLAKLGLPDLAETIRETTNQHAKQIIITALQNRRQR